MSLPAPTLLVAHAVFQLPNPLARDPARDEIFIAAVRDGFPNVVSRQLFPPEVPIQTPHLSLASSSSQLAVSPVQADFEVRFYGDFVGDLERSLEYVEQKMLYILRGFSAVNVAPAMVGLIGTLHFSFKELNESPVAHVLKAHLRTEVDPEEIQDALARVALKVRDTYFVTMTVGNYESRVLERPLMPGMTAIRIRPWEGRIDDHGVELTLDINNSLEGRVNREDPQVTEEGVHAVVRLVREIAHSAGPMYAETGRVSVDDLTAASSKS